MKVLGTTINIPINYWRKAEQIIGESIPRNEFRVICKCRGIDDANRKCHELGFREKTFIKNRTSETGNKTELELCETEDVWIVKNSGCKQKYISISQLNSL